MLQARFFEAEAVPAHGDLIRRRVEPGTPYDLEDLDRAPPDHPAFFARFLRERGAAAAASYPCLYLVKEGPLDIGLHHPSLLAQWKSRREGARRFMKLWQEALPQMKPKAKEKSK